MLQILGSKGQTSRFQWNKIRQKQQFEGGGIKGGGIKVTILPEFFGTFPNFEGLSRKNIRSFGTLNCTKFQTLCRVCPD